MGLTIFVVGMSLLALALITGGIWLILSQKAKRTTDPWFAVSDLEEFSASRPSEPGLPGHIRPEPESRPGSYFDGGCMLIFSLFWTGISLAFLILPLVMFWQELQDYILLKNSGQTAEAVIIDRRIDYDSEGDDYYVTYQFTAPLPQGDRPRFSREQKVNEETYYDLPPESRITIVYAASDPTVSRPQDRLGPPYYLLLIAGLGGLFVVVGVVVFIGGWQAIAESRKLSRRGQLTQGTVIDRWTDKDSDGDLVYCVAFEFSLPGQPRLTKAEYNRAAYHILQTGDPVSVRYYPEKPDMCRIEL